MIARALFVLLFLLFLPALAQDPPRHWPTGASDGGAALGSADVDQVAAVARWHEPVEIVFSVTVLLFGLALIIVFTTLVRREGKGWQTIYLRLVVLTIVVTSGLFVIVAGYTQDQITPMMGLLGTLVGYLLGKEGSAGEPARSKESPAES